MANMQRRASFDIGCLESEEVKKLYCETTSYVQGIRIEAVSERKGHGNREAHPAMTIGLTLGDPTILFSDSLSKEERIEAISHELAHLILVYRFGLGVIGLRIPPHGDPQEFFNFCMNMNKDWAYLLGQVVNTAHHLILTDYLREEYGIESSLHLRLLQHNFHIIANDDSRDKEALYARGLIAFEYEKLTGRIDPYGQSESFRKAYDSAKSYFGRYRFNAIPTSFSYQEDILYFLEALGYQREDFVFFPADC